MAPGPGWSAGAIHLDHSTNPAPPRADHPATTQTPTKLLPPIRSRPTQRMLAVRLHPLAAGRRHRHRDPQLARRPLPIPAGLHRLPPSQRARRRRQLHRHRQHLWPASIHPHRQRLGLHRTIHPRPQRIRTPSRQPWASPRKTATPDTPKLRARSNASTKPSNAGSPHDRGPPPHRPANPARHLRQHLQHRTRAPGPTPTHHTRTGLHRATQSRPPGHPADEHFRVRHDTVDHCGKLTLRHASRLHHLGIGITHAGTQVLIIVTTTTVTVLTTPEYQLIASHTIDPNHNYWRNQQKRPGRWPGRSVIDDATQV